MNKRTASAAVLLAALAAAAPGARADEVVRTPASVASAERLIAEKTDQTAALEKRARGLPAEKALTGRCEESFSFEAFLRGAGATADFGEELNGDLAARQACAGWVQNGPRACDELPTPRKQGDGAPADRTGLQRECRELYWQAARTKVLLTAGTDPEGARRLCALMMAGQGDSGLSGDPATLCGIYVGNAGDARARVDAMWPYVRPSGAGATKAEAVRRELQSMGRADAAECAADEDRSDRQSCLAARAFRAARAKGDAEACGDSGLCRALMGQGPKSCSPYDQRLARAYCGRRDKGSERSEWQAERNRLVEETTSLQRNLMDVIAALDSMEPKDRPENRALRAKAEALNARCDRVLRALPGFAPPKDGAKGARGRAPK